MQIDYSEEALHNLRVLPRRFADQIIRKISRLEDGLTGDIKRPSERRFRLSLRSGDYRILFDVIGDHIVLQKVKKRSEAYDYHRKET
jgi:mRNA-degrading endonuclease RelE of RelBE toxin-antitoxin system